jgi:hypothetical protein
MLFMYIQKKGQGGRAGCIVTVGRGTMGVVVADENQLHGRVGQNERTADIPLG